MVLTILPMGSIALNQGVITVENWKEADLTSDKYIFNACNAAPGYDEVYGDYVALTATNYGQYAAINFDCDLSAYSDPVVGMLLLDASGTPTCTISAMVDGVDEEGNSVSNAVSVLTFTGVQNEWGFRMAALAVDGTTLTEISGIKVQPSSYSKLRIGAIYIGERRDVEKLSPEYVEPLPYEVVEDWSDADLSSDKYTFFACSGALGSDETYGDYVAMTPSGYNQSLIINYDCDLSEFSDPVIGVLLFNSASNTSCVISALSESTDEDGNPITVETQLLSLTGVQNEWGFHIAPLTGDGISLSSISGVKLKPNSYGKLSVGLVVLGERQDVVTADPDYTPYDIIEDWTDADLTSGKYTFNACNGTLNNSERYGDYVAMSATGFGQYLAINESRDLSAYNDPVVGVLLFNSASNTSCAISALVPTTDEEGVVTNEPVQLLAYTGVQNEWGFVIAPLSTTTTDEEGQSVTTLLAQFSGLKFQPYAYGKLSVGLVVIGERAEVEAIEFAEPAATPTPTPTAEPTPKPTATVVPTDFTEYDKLVTIENLEGGDYRNSATVDEGYFSIVSSETDDTWGGYSLKINKRSNGATITLDLSTPISLAGYEQPAIAFMYKGGAGIWARINNQYAIYGDTPRKEFNAEDWSYFVVTDGLARMNGGVVTSLSMTFYLYEDNDFYVDQIIIGEYSDLATQPTIDPNEAPPAPTAEPTITPEPTPIPEGSFYVNFEDCTDRTLPDGMTTYSNTETETWSISDYDTLHAQMETNTGFGTLGSYSAAVIPQSGMDGYDAWLTLPALNLSALESPAISFMFMSRFIRNDSGYRYKLSLSQNQNLKVHISTDGENWVELWDMMSLAEIGVYDWDWTFVNISIPEQYADQTIQIAFEFFGNDAAYALALDEIELGECKQSAEATDTTIYGWRKYNFTNTSAPDCWVAFNPLNPSETAEIESTSSFGYNCFTYVYDRLFAVSASETDYCKFYELDPDTREVINLIKTLSGFVDVTAITYDYTTDIMYAAVNVNYQNAFATIDIETGVVNVIKIYSSGGTGDIACSPSGVIYGITAGDLITIDKATGDVSTVGPLMARSSVFYQGLTFDQNTGVLYWARFGGNLAYGYGDLRVINTETGLSTKIGTIGNGDEIAGLHIPVDSGSIVRRTITASVNNDEYGLIDPLGDTLVREGYGKTFTFYPYAGHYIEAILIDGVAIDLVNDEGYDALTGTYTFTNVILDHTIEIVYAVTYLTVVFVDWDNTELDRQQVAFGAAATAPADPQREGYTFVGWDQTFTSVRRDMTVTAVYEENAIVIVGDVNGDGVLDVGDALAIMRYVVGFTDGTGYNMDNGDYNGDGTVDMGDALGILRAAAMKRGAAGSQRREDVK